MAGILQSTRHSKCSALLLGVVDSKAHSRLRDSERLVELMGGDRLFDSREGKGTRVAFTLPELPEPLEPAAGAAERWSKGATPAGLDAAGRSHRVLIVEDDASSRYGLKSLLESEGYRVEEAGSLAEAESLAGRLRPDVVVLDITLPDRDRAGWLRLRQKKGKPEVSPIPLHRGR